MRDLAICARVIDGDILIMLVSIDDFLISTKSETARSKVVSYLKQYFPLNNK